MSRSADEHPATGAGDHLRAIRASLQSARNNHEPQAPEVQSRNQRPRTPEPKTAQPASAQPEPPSTLAGGELQRLIDAIEALTAKYEMEQAAHRQTLDLLIAQQQAHIDTLHALIHQHRSST